MSDSNKINLEMYHFWVDAMVGAGDLQTMGTQMTQLLVGGLGIKGATLFVVNPQREELEILSTTGLSTHYVNKGPILVDKSIQLSSNREPVIISDTENTDRLQYPEKAKAEGIRSIVSIPVTPKGLIIGALRLYHGETWDVSESDLRFLKVLSQNIGMELMYFRLLTAVSAVKDTVGEIHSVWL